MYKPIIKVLQKSGIKSKTKRIPEYLEPHEVEALMRAAPNPKARLSMLIQWRAGLRVSEAINVTRTDVHIESETPELKVRQR